ncbi:MAG TPA: hypothetical protein VFQ40_07425 [Actinomycetota bacterium]|nr:hypothetical protein [Actinomycetota bacterium]
MEYDPESSDPRYLPDVSEDVYQRSLDEATNTVEKIQIQIGAWESIQALFESTGWANLAIVVAQEADGIDHNLRVITEHPRWMYERGKRSMADFVLTLPQLTERALNTLKGRKAVTDQEIDRIQSDAERGR